MQAHSEIAEPCAIAATLQPPMAMLPALLEAMPQAIAMVDHNLQYCLTSHQWQLYFQLASESCLGQPLHPAICQTHPQLAVAIACCLTTAQASVLAGSRTGSGDRSQAFTWQLTPWYDGPTVAGVILSVLPQPAEVLAASPSRTFPDGLCESHQRLERIIQQMPIAVIEWTPDLHIVEWNPAAEHLFGYPRAAAIGQTIDLVTPDDCKPELLELAAALIANSDRGQQLTHNISQNLTQDGRIMTCEWHNTRLVNANGELIGMASMAVDVSDRQQTSAQIQEQEQFLRSIYDGVDCAVFVVDVTADGNFFYRSYNQTAERWTGMTTAEVVGQTPEERFGPTEGAWIRQVFQRCVAQGQPLTEEEHLTFAEREVWLMATFNPIKDLRGRIYRIVGTSFDITRLKQTQAALQVALQNTEYQSYLLRTVLDASPDWIYAKDQAFRYILVNKSLATALGTTIENILGKTDIELGFAAALVFGDATQPCSGFRAEDQSVLAGQVVCNPCDPVMTADGALRMLDTRKMPLRDADNHVFALLGIGRDWTDRHHAEVAIRQSEQDLKAKAAELEQTLQELRQTQAQLVQNEKMSSLGQLVAGVAHEINNPVNFIYGNLNHANSYIQELLELIELYQTHYPQPVAAIQAKTNEIDVEFLLEDLPKLLVSMKVGADRIQKIIASLRTFSRMDEAEMKAVNIHDGIDSTLMILQSRIKATDQRPAIAVHLEYGDLPPVECYAGQLNQVFMNVLSNAIDALEEVVQAERQIAATVRFSPTITIRTRIQESNWVEIAIADNGSGIPETIQSRLFDPFFTTKPVGKGTGMGLSISYQIVTEKHGGRFTCQSTLGSGTQFIIQIPLLQPSPAEPYR